MLMWDTGNTCLAAEYVALYCRELMSWYIQSRRQAEEARKQRLDANSEGQVVSIHPPMPVTNRLIAGSDGAQSLVQTNLLQRSLRPHNNRKLNSHYSVAIKLQLQRAREDAQQISRVADMLERLITLQSAASHAQWQQLLTGFETARMTLECVTQVPRDRVAMAHVVRNYTMYGPWPAVLQYTVHIATVCPPRLV